MSLNYGIGLDTSQMERDVQKANQLFKKVGDHAENEANRISEVFGIGKRTIAGLFSAAAAEQFVSKLIDVRGEFQQLEIAFTTMLKSKEKADKLLADVTKFASTTPFDLQQVATGTKQLLAYGFAADSIQDNLSMIGNVASGVGSQIGDLIYLYGTLKASGRVTQMDINQFAGRGIPIYEELAKVLETNVSQVRNLVSEGKVGFPQIEKAFQNMTNEGGMFYNLMQEQSKSLSGQMSNLGDTISKAFNEIGKSQEGVLSEGISGVSYLVENYQEVGKLIGGLVITYGAYKASVMALTAINQVYTASKVGMTTAEVAHYVAISATDKAQKLLNATILKNPYMLAAAALVTLGYGMFKLVTYQTEAEKAQSKLNESFKKNNTEIATEKVQIDTLFARLKAAKKGTEEYDAAKKAIFSKYGEYLKNLGDENTALKNIDAAYRAVSESATKAARARGLASANEQASADYVNKQAGILDKIKSEIESIYGKDSKKSLDIFFQIKPLVQSGKGLDSFSDKFLKQFDIIDTQAKQYQGKYDPKNRLKDLITEGVLAKKTFEDVNKEAELLFGESPTKPTNQLKDGDTKTEGGVDYIYKGGKWVVIPKTQTKEELEKAKKTAQEKADLELQIKNNSIKSGFEQRQAELDKQNATTNAMQDGFLKQKQIIEDDHNQKLLDIERRTQELVEKQQKEERLLWEADGSKGVFKPKTTNSDQLDNENKNLLGTWKQTVEISFVSNREKLLKDLNDTYLSFTEKRREIDSKFTNDETILKETFAGDVLTEKLNKLNEDHKNALQQINEDEVNSVARTSDLLVQLFTDSSTKSVEELKKVATEAETLLNYLKNTSTENITSQKIGGKTFSKSELTSMKSDKGFMSDLGNQVKDVKNTAGSADKVFGTFGSNLKKTFDLFKGGKKSVGETKDGIDALSGAFGTLSSFSGQAVGLLESMSKEEGDAASSAAKSIGAVMDVAGSTLQGFQQGGIVGGAVAFAMSVATKIFAAEKAHQQALLEIQNEKNAQQKEYNDLLLKQNELLERSETIFGKDAFGSALGYAKVADNMLNAANKANASLYSAKVVTGSHKTGLFGWGGEKKEYTAMLSVYPGLIDGQGKLNKEMAESILNNRKLDSTSKAALEAALKYAQEYDDALTQLNDYLTSVFGSLGADMMTAITDNLGDTKSALDDFADSAAGTIEKLMTDIAYSMFFADKFKALSDSVLAVQKDAEMTPEQKAAKETELLGEFYKNIGNDVEAANKFLKDSKDAAAAAGFDLWEESRKGAKKGIATASQESVDENNGRLTVIQGHTFMINENTASIKSDMALLRENSGAALRHLAGIETNTARLEAVESAVVSIKSGIDTINMKGVKLQ